MIVITAEIESRLIAKDDLFHSVLVQFSSCGAPLQTEASMGGRKGQRQCNGRRDPAMSFSQVLRMSAHCPPDSLPSYSRGPNNSTLWPVLNDPAQDVRLHILDTCPSRYYCSLKSFLTIIRPESQCSHSYRLLPIASPGGTSMPIMISQPEAKVAEPRLATGNYPKAAALAPATCLSYNLDMKAKVCQSAVVIMLSSRIVIDDGLRNFESQSSNGDEIYASTPRHNSANGVVRARQIFTIIISTRYKSFSGSRSPSKLSTRILLCRLIWRSVLVAILGSRSIQEFSGGGSKVESPPFLYYYAL
ncbi:hypothetical protein TNCV_862261 [Trichonephila clavipes]|nr:hypothetical protein TNCV_862261 [Trichonephila clavipes]